MQNGKPSTQSERYLQLRQMLLKTMIASRQPETRCSTARSEQSSETLFPLERIRREKQGSLSDNESEEKAPTGEEYGDELRVIARARAYFDIAYGRVLDVVPMIIENEFFVGLSVDLQKNLTKNLGLIGKIGEENCARYCVEEPEIKAKRASLTRKLKILADATELLDTVG